MCPGESSKPWFGAQASTFKWIPNLGKHPGPIEPSKWWPEEDHDTEGAQNLEERRPHNGLSSVFGGELECDSHISLEKGTCSFTECLHVLEQLDL